VSQDNENKPDDFDFDFNVEEEKTENENGELFLEDPFNSTFPNETESLQNETELSESENLSFPPIGEMSESLGEVPSIFLTKNSDPAEESEEIASEENSETTAPDQVSVNIDKINTNKKNKTTKGKKETKARSKKDPKKGEALGFGAGLCLTSSGLLLLALIAVNVIMLVFQPYKEFDVSFSATIYYLVGVDIIGGVGIVAVPFMLYKYRKENDLFQTLLGLSVMALSFAVLILMTEFLRYNFTGAPTSALPNVAPVVLSNTAPAE
jgi:hypothetical protein